LLEDRFESTSNRDQIERTEDFYLGTRLWASVGYATEDFGADRESVLYRFEASSGFGSMEKKALLLSSSLTGRLDEGKSANSEISLNARYYNQISDKRLFFMTLDASAGDNLDLDNLVDLGGDTGLRGYPLRYQTGESRALLTIEERYFTDWYPFRLFRVGGAAFIDIGRVWGDSPLGNEPLGWLKDIGLGLRLAPTRASGRDVIHIDVAFPLDGDPTIDNVQFLIQSKRSF
jgi:hemolysin activation/secretion protein